MSKLNKSNSSKQSKFRSKSSKKFSYYNVLKAVIVLTFAVCSFIFLLSITMFLKNIIDNHNEIYRLAVDLYSENKEDAVDIFKNSSYLSTEFITIIIAIFAIIVTIWIGLNIYNVISKDELQNLSDKASDISKKAKNATNKINSLYDAYADSNYINFQATFQKAQKEYAATNYVIEHFNELISKSNPELVLILHNIEIFYHSAMESYYGENKSDSIMLAEMAYEKCKELTNIEASMKNKVLMGYLHMRIANLQYFISQTVDIENLNQCVKHCKDAITFWFPKVDNISNYNKQELYSLMDIYNLIAISIHHIIINSKSGKDNKKLYKEMRDYYNKLEELLTEENLVSIYPSRYSMYMRNIGTSLDFVFNEFIEDKNILTSGKCLDYYKKALSANPKESKNYRNIISFNLKQFKNGYLDYRSKDVRLQYLKKMIEYATIYINLLPYSVEPYSFLGATYALKYILTNEREDLLKYQENIDIAIIFLSIEENDKIKSKLGKEHEHILSTRDILDYKEFKFNYVLTDDNIDLLKNDIDTPT